MNASQNTKVAYFNYIGSIELPEWVIDHMPRVGNCDNALLEFMEDEAVSNELNKLDAADLKTELSECGAWTDEELDDHQENLLRILWIAITDIIEEEYENNRDK